MMSIPDGESGVMQNADQPEVRVPEGRKLDAEETALAQFRLLVDTYAQGITKLNGEIGNKDIELQKLDEARARVARERDRLAKERDTKFGLMEDANAMVRKREDIIRDRDRAEADEARRAAALG